MEIIYDTAEGDIGIMLFANGKYYIYDCHIDRIYHNDIIKQSRMKPFETINFIKKHGILKRRERNS